MASANKFYNIAMEGYKIFEYIENNLHKDPKKLIEDLQRELHYPSGNNFDEVGSTLRRRFEDVYISKNKDKETILKYIKRRQSASDDHEEKYDMGSILDAAVIMNAVENCGFCKVDIDKYKVYKYYNTPEFYQKTMSEIDYEKMFKSIFSSRVYIYPYLYLRGNLDDVQNIVDFNLDYIFKERYNDKNDYLRRIFEFNLLYYASESSVLVINNLMYFIGNRTYLDNNYLEKYEYINTPDDLSKYKTILYKTKDALIAIMGDDSSQEDINKEYDKSIQECLKNMNNEERIMFDAILGTEEGRNRNLTVNDFYSPIEMISDVSSYDLFKSALNLLLKKGYVYIDK